MKQRLSGKAMLVVLLVLALLTPLAGCFEYHNERDRHSDQRERHDEDRGGDRH